MNTNYPIWPNTYAPAPEIPRWFRDGLLELGGRNPVEPTKSVYQVVWGMDARTFMNGDPRSMKYPNPNDTTLGWACWMLERWVPPTFFKEQEWNDARYGPDTAGTGNLIDYLGPYKNYGDYILVFPLMSDSYEPLELSSGLLDLIRSRVKVSHQTTKEDILVLVELERRRKAAIASAIVDNQLEEQREYYRTNKDRLNALASRDYVGLEGNTLPALHKLAAADLPHTVSILPSVKELLCRQNHELSNSPLVAEGCSTETP